MRLVLFCLLAVCLNAAGQVVLRINASLPANEGLLRIVVPHDLRPTRSIRMLKEIDVVQLKQ